MGQMPSRFPPPPEADPRWGAAQPPPAQGPGGWVGYPLTIGRVLELTFSLFRFRFAAFVAVSLVLMLPVFVVIGAVQLLVGQELAAAQQAQLDAIDGRPVDLARLVPFPALLVSYLSIALVGLTGFLAHGAVAHMTAEAFAGATPSASGALRKTFSKVGRLLGAGLLVMLTTYGLIVLGVLVTGLLFIGSVVGGQLQPGIAVFVGLIAIVTTIALVILLVTRWYFVSQAVMVEDQPARKSLGRSWRLVSGSTWRVIGYALFFGLLIGVFLLLLEVVLSLVVGSGFRVVGGAVVFEPTPFLVNTFIEALLSAALLPVTVIGMTILYFDIRFRRGEDPLATFAAASVVEQESQPGVER